MPELTSLIRSVSFTPSSATPVDSTEPGESLAAHVIEIVANDGLKSVVIDGSDITPLVERIFLHLNPRSVKCELVLGVRGKVSVTADTMKLRLES